jgi:hypothetical protein
MLTSFLTSMFLIISTPSTAEASEEVEEISTEEVSTVDPSSQYYGESYGFIDRTFNQLTARPTRPRTFNAIIAHRTNTGVGRDAFHNFLGFDGGSLKVALGLRYGIIDHLDAGFMRVNGTSERFDTYEWDVRYQFLNQAQHHIDVAARAGLAWYSQADAKDGLGGFGQVLASGVLFNRLMLGGSVTYHSDSSGAVKKTTSHDYSVAVSAQAEYRFTESFAYAVESSMTVFITNANRTNAKDWVLGFNITREFGL